jgi:AraC-like DNA-binding protein
MDRPKRTTQTPRLFRSKHVALAVPFERIPGGLRIAYMITACPVSMHSAQVDSAFAGLLGLLRRCCSIRLSPEVVALPGVSSILSRNYENTLQCNAVAHSERPFMSFHTAGLDRPHPGADPELLSLALRQAGIMLRARSRTDTLVDHVQAMIVAQGVDRADCASVASSMSVSVRTLQRRLEGCGTGFRRLLEATRMEEAVRLLGDRSQTLTGIAEILGYSDLSGLFHAVRSHWGSSPRHLREEILSTSGYATLTEPSLARQMNSN